MRNFDLIHPREQLVLMMRRVYQHGMTTTSGGNLSVRDDEGNVWITPAGIDKGNLGWEDIVCVKKDGTIKGRHKPSSEYPFHKAIYEKRPDLTGILHAHPSPLVSFSIVRRVPSIRLIPQAHDVCGNIGYAPYGLPGSEDLGMKIAHTFGEGFDCIILENHGVVCGGKNILEAFHRFETFDFSARLEIQGKILGTPKELTDEELQLFHHGKNNLPEFTNEKPTSKEKALRRHICEIKHRSYDMQLMTSTEGVVSVRLKGNDFLISPTSKDRRLVDIEDVVLIKDGKREKGKFPSRSVVLHQEIYKDHPEINAIVSAQAPHIMAYGVTETPIETRTIPESYILLRDIPKLPFGKQMTDEAEVSSYLGDETPMLLLQNDAIIATGDSLLKAFDRLEVAEFTARSLIDAFVLGGVTVMEDDDIKELDKAFLGK